MIAFCELRPVQCNHKLGAIAGDKLKPDWGQIFDGQQFVANQSVHLLDGVFGSQTAGACETTSDVRDARLSRSERTEHRAVDRTERLFV